MQNDHDKLDSLFNEYQNLCSIHEALPIFKEFRKNLERHIGWEEEILFPTLEKKLRIANGGPIMVMNMEHLQIKNFLDEIEKKLLKHQIADETNGNLVMVLGQHNFKEENILYPAIDDSLSANEKEEILTRLK